MSFNNPVVSGGGALTYPQIKSPDYAPDVAGWSINRDGSAEFNDLIVRGVLTIEHSGEGVFVYNGAGALGNLVASIASVNGVDQYGNLYPMGVAGENQGGFTARGDNSGHNYLIAAVPASNNPILIYNHNNTLFVDGYIQSLQDGTAPYSGKMTWQSAAPTGRTAAAMEMLSQLSDGSHGPVTKIHSDLIVDGPLTASASATVTGVMTAGNMISGSVTITPVANTPTSLVVPFPGTLQGTTFSAQVSVQTGVPGTTVLGVGYTALTATSITVVLTRTNVTPTVVSYLAIGQ